MSEKKYFKASLMIFLIYNCISASYGFETSKPFDYEEMLRVATVGVNAIKADSGTVFDAGQSSTLMRN